MLPQNPTGILCLPKPLAVNRMSAFAAKWNPLRGSMQHGNAGGNCFVDLGYAFLACLRILYWSSFAKAFPHRLRIDPGQFAS